MMVVKATRNAAPTAVATTAWDQLVIKVCEMLTKSYIYWYYTYLVFSIFMQLPDIEYFQMKFSIHVFFNMLYM